MSPRSTGRARPDRAPFGLRPRRPATGRHPSIETLEGRALQSGFRAPHPAAAAPAALGHHPAQGPALLSAMPQPHGSAGAEVSALRHRGGHARHLLRPQPHTPFLRLDIPSLYPASAWNLRNLQFIQAEHNAHVAFLVAALGPNARPKPQFQNLTAPDAVAFVTLARTIEDTGAGAYLGAAPYIDSRMILAQSGTLSGAVAQNAGYLNTLLNGPVVGSGTPFALPLTVAEVNARTAPFIADLNGGPPPTYSTTPSPANDIAILNYALLLEYLAADFYNTNVPLYQGVVG